ncbi:hypothetical protein C4J81_03475 [Deltaproteobacteria bacterium Smac51]|nr:hypothetical protein C4J81_03475 [Deltaproteobacteria bacterium Smac51]
MSTYDIKELAPSILLQWENCGEDEKITVGKIVRTIMFSLSTMNDEKCAAALLKAEINSFCRRGHFITRASFVKTQTGIKISCCFLDTIEGESAFTDEDNQFLDEAISEINNMSNKQISDLICIPIWRAISIGKEVPREIYLPYEDLLESDIKRFSASAE